jgi:6-phosphogluconate dehydrogenase
MDIAMIGLGRMGANMAQRLHRGGHRVVGYDPGEGARQRAAEAGIEVVDSLPAGTINHSTRGTGSACCG